MLKIQIEIDRSDEDCLNKLKSVSDDAIVAYPDHFEGGIEITSIILSVTTVSLPLVAGIIREHIRAKRFIKVKKNGVEVSGESLKKIESFFKNSGV